MPDEGKRRSPAFLFYASDFYSACADLEPADVGVYILLLCQQWDRGGLPADVAVLSRLARGKVRESVLQKFPVGEDGLRRNARLERERAAHSAYIDGKSRAGKESARVRAAARANRQTGQQEVNGVDTVLGSCSDTVLAPVADSLGTKVQPPNPNPNPKYIEPTSQALQGALVPSEAEVLAFCGAFEGRPVHGIPPGIPTAWALNWMAWRFAPGRPPLVDWRGELVRKFTAEFAERRPLAIASISAANPGAPAPKKGADLPAWRQLEEAKAEWKSSPLNPDSSAYMGDDQMTPRLREKAAALAAAAGE